jgi:general secretion pathway protein D
MTTSRKWHRIEGGELPLNGWARRAAYQLGLVCLLAGCADAPVVDQATARFGQGQVQESLADLRTALQEHPHDTQLRMAYLTLKDRAVNDWLAAASSSESSGQSAQWLRKVLEIDPDNSRAVAGLSEIDRQERLAKAVLDAQVAFDTKDYAGARTKVRAVLLESPRDPRARELMERISDKLAKPPLDASLQEALSRDLSIDFKDASLRQVFDVISKTVDINFVLDRDIKSDQRVTLQLKNISVGDALEMILVSNQLERRVLGHKGILVYQNTPAKQKEYDILNVRTFLLANADAEQVAGTLKSVLKVQDVSVDKTQNAVLLRDTPTTLEMAEKLVALEDMPTAEAMIDVEVLEVNRDRLVNFGVQFPPSISLTPLPLTSGGTLTLSDLRHLRLGNVGAGVAATAVNVSGVDTDVKTLANPRIRVRSRETAKILIGDRVPNITSTATSTGFVSETVQYQDVGLKLEITPTITIDDQVTMKISLEVSNIARQITTAAGTAVYQIGTRSASTVLRLKDGENQVLAGLINRQDNRTVNKVPWLGDIPIAGRLFSSVNSDGGSSEIVLSITPRLVRNTPRPDAQLLDFESGTDSSHQSAGFESVPGKTKARTTSEPRREDQVQAHSAVSTAAGAASPGVAAAASTPGPGLAWQGPAQVSAEAPFQESLQLSLPQPVTGMVVAIGFDPRAVQVVGVSEGNALNADGTATSFTQRVDVTTGQIFIACARASSARALAPQGTFATVNLRSTGMAGSTQLRTISINAATESGGTLPVASPPPQTIEIGASR